MVGHCQLGHDMENPNLEFHSFYIFAENVQNKCGNIHIQVVRSTKNLEY